MSCPVCAGRDLVTFVARDGVPVHQNLVFRTADAARQIARGRLDMRLCRRCGFAFNAAFDASLLGYGEHYDNTQTCSPAFRAYVDELVAHVLARRAELEAAEASFVEVGCGKGAFIRALLERSPRDRGWGFDPSYEGELAALGGRLAYRREYYGPSCAELRADLVVCRHVIEHVADPVALLSTVHAALASSAKPRIFFETPALEWILAHRVVWDFFYEHCSLFSRASLATAAERAGFARPEVRTIFGEQYLWLEAERAAAAPEPRYAPGDLVALAEAYRADEAAWLARWSARLTALAATTGVAIWGAGAKGVTFANLVDPRGERIVCVVDVNPNKQGGFLPGTGHPIVAPAELPARGVGAAILMNPNYRGEIAADLATRGIAVALVEDA